MLGVVRPQSSIGFEKPEPTYSHKTLLLNKIKKKKLELKIRQKYQSSIISLQCQLLLFYK